MAAGTSSTRPPAAPIGRSGPPPRLDGLPAILGSIPLTLLFLTLVVTPLGLTVVLSFSPFDYNKGVLPGQTLAHYAMVFSDPYFLGIFFSHVLDRWCDHLDLCVDRRS